MNTVQWGKTCQLNASPTFGRYNIHWTRKGKNEFILRISMIPEDIPLAFKRL